MSRRGSSPVEPQSEPHDALVDEAERLTPSWPYAQVSRQSMTGVRLSRSSLQQPAPLLSCDGKAQQEPLVITLRRHWVVWIYSLVGVLLFVLLVHLSYFAARMDDGSSTEPTYLTCREWAFDTSCGLNGVDCQPFETDWTAFRCPGHCAWDQSSALAVYGSSPYRGDSRICRAAIHAGVIGSNGGCGLLRYAGAATSFKASTAHGVTSIEYASWFPKTIEFKAASSLYCTDLAWVLLALGIAVFFGFALLPRTNPAMLFYALVAWGFFYVQIAGQTSNVDYAGMIIDSLGEIVVLLAASTWLYRLAPANTFSEWESRSLKQRVVLWGCCYVLPYHVLLNMTFLAYVPWLNVDLGGYESSTTNGWTYVVFGLIGILAILCGWHLLKQLYRTMRWKKLMLAYAVVLLYVLLSWAMFSTTSFHLHHTMLGAFLLPITRFPTPLAAVAQSIALGLFVQGYAAWGWTSYLDVKSDYLTIDQPAVAPEAANVTTTQAHVSWEALDGVTGYSLRLNEVEVYHGSGTHTTITGLEPNLMYFLTVVGIADWGTDGQESPTANFTTLAT